MARNGRRCPDEARRSVDKLVAGVGRLLPDGAQNLFGEYCIADTVWL